MDGVNLEARERIVAYGPARGMAEWVVSVVGGPQDLLARGTREMALADGAAYVAAHWERRADGRWVPK